MCVNIHLCSGRFWTPIMKGKRMLNPLYMSPQEKIVLDNLLNGVCLINATKNIVYWNAAAEHMLGYTPDDIMNKMCYDDVFLQDAYGDILCDKHCPLDPQKDFVSATISTSFRHKDGYRLPMQMRCVPLLNHENKVMGAVRIFNVTHIREDINLKLKELGQFAYLDSLTSIPNRRYMEEMLQEWLQPHNRKNVACAVVMGDIDFFKDINDKYGHDTGDFVLKKVADTLRQNLRVADIVGRWGGEEFLIILQEINVNQLYARLESLRKAIEDCEIASNGVFIKVTMSFGATMTCKEDTTASVMVRADEFLYKSKREGRNRVSIAEETVD